MAKNIKQYEQQYLPSPEGSSVKSLPGEKRTPTQISTSREKLFNVAGEVLDEFQDMRQKIKMARDVDGVSNAIIDIDAAGIDSVNYFDKQENLKGLHYDQYTEKHGELYKKSTDKLYEKYKDILSSDALKQVSTHIKRREITSSNDVLTRAEKAETRQLNKNAWTRLDNAIVNWRANIADGNLTNANMIQENFLASLQASLSTEIINSNEFKKMKNGFFYETQYVQGHDELDVLREQTKPHNDNITKKKGIEVLSQKMKYYKGTIPNMNPHLRQQLYNKAEGYYERAVASKKSKNYAAKLALRRFEVSSLSKKENENFDMTGHLELLQDAYPDDPERIAAELEDHQIKMGHAGENYNIASKIYTLSPEDQNEEINKLSKKAKSTGVGYEHTKARLNFAAAAREKSKQDLKTDSFSYVVKHDEATSIDEVISGYKRRGLPKTYWRVLPVNKAKELVETITVMDGEDIVNSMISLNQEYKTSQQKKILHKNLKEAGMSPSLLIALTMDPITDGHDQIMLAEISKGKSTKDIQDILGFGDDKDEIDVIKESISKAMKPYINATFYQDMISDNIVSTKEVHNVLYTLTLAHMLKDPERNTAIAVQKAIKSILPDEKLIKDSYIIPKQYSHISKNVINYATKVVLDKYTYKDLHNKRPDGRPIYWDDEDKKITWERIKNDVEPMGMEDGIVLVRKGTNKIVRVVDKDGKVEAVEITWKFISDNVGNFHQKVEEYAKEEFLRTLGAGRVDIYAPPPKKVKTKIIKPTKYNKKDDSLSKERKERGLLKKKKRKEELQKQVEKEKARKAKLRSKK